MMGSLGCNEGQPRYAPSSTMLRDVWGGGSCEFMPRSLETIYCWADTSKGDPKLVYDTLETMGCSDVKLVQNLSTPAPASHRWFTAWKFEMGQPVHEIAVELVHQTGHLLVGSFIADMGQGADPLLGLHRSCTKGENNEWFPAVIQGHGSVLKRIPLSPTHLQTQTSEPT